MYKPNNIRNLAKQIIDDGGDIAPILIPFHISEGWSQTNPSVIVINGEIIVNLRCVEYSLIHSDKDQKFWSRWGPLTYSHSENLMALRTFNVLCKMNPNTLLVEKQARINTSELDTPPIWTFHGLEDCRLSYWEGKLYAIGVRRDVKPNGEGRMQYQEIDFSFNDEPYAREVKRNRIEPPFDAPSYCEKNWMPVLDKPHHFIKWTNPTELVKANLETNKSDQIHIGQKTIPLSNDQRGGSQVIKWGDGWLALTHEYTPVHLNNEFGYKDAYYFSRFVQWDSDWNIIGTSDSFSFLDGRIEFVVGMDHLNEDSVVITFGFCDCGAYIVRMNKNTIQKMINQKW
jgi:hypothetical protein